MTYILITLLVVTVATIVILVKALNIQLSKVQVYEQWILELRVDVIQTLVTMRELDRQQIFEKDDEVGTVFQQLLGLLEKLNQRTQLENEKEEKEEHPTTEIS